MNLFGIFLSPATISRCQTFFLQSDDGVLLINEDGFVYASEMTNAKQTLQRILAFHKKGFQL